MRLKHVGALLASGLFQKLRGGVERLANYLKLQDEMRDLDARKDVRARIDEKRKVKIVSQSLKQLYKSRDRE